MHPAQRSASRGRFGGLREWGAVDDGRGSQTLQMTVGLGAAGRCDDLKSQFCEERNRDGTDAARSACDQYLARARLEPVLLESHDGQHRGKSSGADRHRLPGGQTRRQWHEPIAVDRRLLRQAAPLDLADAPAGQQNLRAGMVSGVAALEYRAREVDAGNVRIVLYQSARTGHDEAVLVIQGRIFHRYDHVSRRQTRFVEALHRGLHRAVAILDYQRLENVSVLRLFEKAAGRHYSAFAKRRRIVFLKKQARHTNQTRRARGARRRAPLDSPSRPCN